LFISNHSHLILPGLCCIAPELENLPRVDEKGNAGEHSEGDVTTDHSAESKPFNRIRSRYLLMEIHSSRETA
jgi:hypothetical protein